MRWTYHHGVEVALAVSLAGGVVAGTTIGVAGGLIVGRRRASRRTAASGSPGRDPSADSGGPGRPSAARSGAGDTGVPAGSGPDPNAGRVDAGGGEPHGEPAGGEFGGPADPARLVTAPVPGPAPDDPLNLEVPLGEPGIVPGTGVLTGHGGSAGTGGDQRTSLVGKARPTGAVRPEQGEAPPEAVRRPAVRGLGRRSLDALRVGVLVLDPDDRPVLANPAAREMGLLRAGATVGGSPTAHSVVRTLAGQARRTGAWREVELDLPRGNGRDPLGVHIRAVALGDGHVTVEAADVTESHRVARVRRDFVANVSHELKTPVGALQLLAEALLDATDNSGEEDGSRKADWRDDVAAARRFAERIQHESVRLGRLVSELLELSRLQGGEPLPEPVPVSVDRIVAEVMDRTRTPATAKGIEVGFTGTRGLTVYGSESQLVTAVGNLVENAIAYSPDEAADRPAPRVTVVTRAGDEYVDIEVSDQGIGIEPKDLDRIFERFYRADKARSRSTGGTGLGLAIVKHIATNHGGQVDVVSKVGVGSTFTLRLPARPPEGALPLPLSVEITTSPVGIGGGWAEAATGNETEWDGG